MSEPYTIRIYVPGGDPSGAKIVELLNWTGIGIALPRSSWPQISKREEFNSSGVYILTGSAEETLDDLPTIYVGQGDKIKDRIEMHYANRDFWDWCYAFVGTGNLLNRAHITWLEHSLIELATKAKRCYLDNGNRPREPSLSESERADTKGFLRELLRILPLLGVHVFEKPEPVAIASSNTQSALQRNEETKNTVIVPALEEGFKRVFLGENRWHAIRIGGGMLSKIKYIAAYQSAPISAVTHYAPVERIEPYGDGAKYQLIFSEPAKELERPIGNAPRGAFHGSRYTSISKLLAAKKVVELFD